jgi:hypothetical protein
LFQFVPHDYISIHRGPREYNARVE